MLYLIPVCPDKHKLRIIVCLMRWLSYRRNLAVISGHQRVNAPPKIEAMKVSS